MKFVVGKVSSLQFAPILLWAIVGCASWYLAARSYESFLGGIVWELFPQQEVYLLLKDHVFSIGLMAAGKDPSPELTLTSHNFGFGMVVTGSVILGARGRSWPLRLVGLCCAWLILLLTHIGLLVTAAHAYLSAATQSEIPLGFSMFLKSVHPTVAVLPIVIIVLWLVIPFEIRGQRKGAGVRLSHRKRRHR